MENINKPIPIIELVGQVQDLKTRIKQHLEIARPDVWVKDIDDITLLCNELEDARRIAIEVFGHMFENGNYME